MIKPPPNVLELPLEPRAVMAFKAAVEKLIIRSQPCGRGIRRMAQFSMRITLRRSIA